MLFDLHGRRRRVVQATYLMLAILMGGGLVLFGIGGDVSGGLFDAFSDRQGGGGGGNTLVEKRVEDAEKRLAANPRDEAALRDLARSHFQLAGQDANADTGQYGEQGKRELAASARSWERYLSLEPEKPDASLAQVMLQAYGEFGLNRPDQATRAAEIVTEAEPTPANFLFLARYARLANQERKADLAGQRAVDLAPKSQRKAVREQLKSFETAAAQSAAGQSGAPTP